jgi:ferredoxin
LTVKKVIDNIIEVEQTLVPGKFAGGDFYFAIEDEERRKITANNEIFLEISPDGQFVKIPLPGGEIEVQVRLQQPFVDIEKCTGCGVCEHECPVSGKKAIIVSAEGETRSADRKLLLKR